MTDETIIAGNPAESDADFLIRIMHLRTCEVVFTASGARFGWPVEEMTPDKPQLSRADALRLIALIGGAA